MEHEAYQAWLKEHRKTWQFQPSGSRFVQIGNRAINLDHVIAVFFAEKETTIVTDGVDGGQTYDINLFGEDIRAFNEWLNKHVEVYEIACISTKEERDG